MAKDKLTMNSEMVLGYLEILEGVIVNLESALECATSMKEGLYSGVDVKITVESAEYYLGYAGSELSDFCESIYQHIQKLHMYSSACYTYIGNNLETVIAADEEIAQKIRANFSHEKQNYEDMYSK